MASEVRAKFEEWKKRLLDFTGRNRLLFFKPTKTGTLDLSGVSINSLFDALVLSTGKIEFEGKPEDDDAPADDPRAATKTTEALPTVRQSGGGMVVRLDRTEKSLRKTLTNLHRRSNQSLLEQGVHTLHMAVGFLEWYEVEHSEQPIRSPLLLVPVQLERQRGGVFVLEPTGEPPEVNIVLLEKLRRDLSIELPEWHEDEDASPDLDAYLAQVRQAVSDLDRSEVHEEAALDIFSFAKLVMYKDLERNTDRALSNELIQGICGDPSPPPEIDVPTEEELDSQLSYADCFHVLDADTSQREAIAAATKGESFILVGPPGTGKSQTIANVIAESIAKGKRVLFVSEKAAALEVVYRRLEECELHHFCLDLHSARGHKREVLEQLGRALEVEPPAGERHQDYSVVEDRRRKLNSYADALHKPFGNLMWTPFHVQSELAKLEEVPRVLASIEPGAKDADGDGLSGVDVRRLAAMQSVMADVEGLNSFFAQGEDHPWWGYRYSVKKVRDQDQLRKTLEQLLETTGEAAELCSELQSAYSVTSIPETIDGLDTRAAICECLAGIGGRAVAEAWLGRENLGPHIERAKEASAAAEALKASRAAIDSRYCEEVWEIDAGGLAERFALYEDSWVKRWFTSGPDKHLLRQHLRDESERRGFGQLAEDVRHLAAQADAARWFEENRASNREWFGDSYDGPATDWATIIELLPVVDALNRLMRDSGYSAEFRASLIETGEETPEPRDLHERMKRCAERLRTLADYLLAQSFDAATEDTVGGTGVGELREWADTRLRHFDELETWQRFRRLRERAREEGVAPWIKHFLQHPDQAGIARNVFQKSFCIQFLDEIYDERDILAEFSIDEFERIRRDFAARDRQAIDEGADRVRRQVCSARGNIKRSAGIGQVATLRREMAKQRRHKPIRQLLSEIPELAQDIAPCMMMSPLTVSQYIGSDRLEFDMVVFDEASQVKPEDALAAIMRASQLILAGDPKQLPPTTFFDSSLEESPDDEVFLDALDSILDETGLWLHERLLSWHYRSRDDELIAFSNHEFYGNRLVTFPDAGNGDSLGVSFVHCEDAPYDRGGTRTNMEEAERAADLVLETVENYPADSVGIVAFSQAQQDAIYDVFEERARVDSRFESFFSDDDDREPLFIKNLETVQGDERDTIIISVGYGRDCDGRLTMNFGPLNREGGARRLNVAVTRARKRVVLVSSMAAQDIDPSAAGGAQLLRRYLDFAARGPDALQTSGRSVIEAESPFEEAVHDALVDRGMQVQTQVGCGPYRIDLGLIDPDKPGRYLLGVECDGRTYHSSRTARDRDRLREQVLEDHGWNLVRIWSTDWWRHPERQIERVLEAFEGARAGTYGSPPEPDDSVLEEANPGHHEALAQDNRTKQQGTDVDGLGEAPEADYGFTPYLPAELGQLGDQDAFYRMAETKARYLLERIRLIVEAEGPVHFDVAMKRLTGAYGISRCGSKIQELMAECVARAEMHSFCRANGDFLWPPDGQQLEVRTNEGSSSPRDIEEFALEEIALAVGTVVEVAHGAPEDDVVREVAHALGFGSTGKIIRERIEQAIEVAIDQGRVQRAGDELLSAD